MGDTPAIAFGLFCLALGILLYRKRSKLIKNGGGPAPKGKDAAPVKSKRFGIPATVLYRIISGCMFLGGVGLASTFIGEWLRSWDLSVGDVPSAAIVTIVAVLLLVALIIDVFDGGGLKPTTYAMLVMFPLMWATAGGSLSWPRALSAWAWVQMTGAI